MGCVPGKYLALIANYCSFPLCQAHVLQERMAGALARMCDYINNKTPKEDAVLKYNFVDAAAFMVLRDALSAIFHFGDAHVSSMLHILMSVGAEAATRVVVSAKCVQ